MNVRQPDKTKLGPLDSVVRLMGDGKRDGVKDLFVIRRFHGFGNCDVCYSFWVPTWRDILKLACGQAVVIGVAHPPANMPPIAAFVGTERSL